MVWKMGPCYQFFTPLRASHPSLSSAAKTEDFNQGLDQVEFPSALQVLSFGAAFNQPFNHVTLPAALKSSMDCIDAMLPCLIMKLLFWKASLVRQTDRQPGRQAGRQTDRDTHTHHFFGKKVCLWYLVPLFYKMHWWCDKAWSWARTSINAWMVWPSPVAWSAGGLFGHLYTYI